MSRLAGVWYFDSRPLAPSDEAFLGSVPLFRAPGMAMVHHAAPATDNACGWDGRLDGGNGPSAAVVALLRYSRGGSDAFRDLIGDWSLALWDARRRSVVLASDYAGIRPLYYSPTADRVAWSSSLADLARWTGAAELDEAYAAGFLRRGSAPGRTPYRGIYSVPTGEAIRIGERGEERHRFWDLPADRELCLAGEREYEERLLELFREAVRVRVKPYARVCAELSGGLDSSSVVSMAASLGADLTTLSYTHEDTFDERFFEAVERQWRLPARHLSLDEHPFTAPDQTGGAAPAWWEPRMRGLASQMESLGATALLTGQLGDFTMGNFVDDSSQAARYLRRGEIGMALREAYDWSRTLRVPIYPILWRAMRLSLSWWTPPSGAEPAAAADSLSAEWRARLAEPDSRRELSWRHALPERRSKLRALGESLQARTLQTPEPLLPFDYSHPFAHRPLVEFMLSIPPGVVCRPGEPRRLMRRAFANLLPQAVLKRRSKGVYGTTFRKALVPMAAEMLREPRRIRVVEMGAVERGSLIERLDRFTQGLECNETQLRNLILLEFWLRNSPLGGRPPATSV